MNRHQARLFTLILLLLFATTNASRGADLPEPARDQVYAQRGDKTLLADVYFPAGEGPFPAVLVVHGGAWRSGSKGQLAFLARRLAQNGYVAVAINYRLAPEFKFPAQIDDCKTAVRWMRENAAKYRIDPDRIAGWGYSAGGHLVALLGTTDADDGLEGDDPSSNKISTRLQAVVPGGAPCDFRLMPPNNDRMAFWLGATRGEKPEIYVKASPAAFVTPDDPPMHFYQGEADELVRTEGVKAMIRRLEEARVPVELFLIPGANHIQAAMNGAAGASGIEFLDRYLKDSGAKEQKEAHANGNGK